MLAYTKRLVNNGSTVPKSAETGQRGMGDMQDGKIVIVTGAASGIGRAVARKFLDQDWRVLAVDRRPDTLDQLVAEHAGVGRGLVGLLADVTDKAAPALIFDHCAARLGRPDCLVNNAGLGNAREALATSDDDWDYYLDINLGGTFRMCRRAVTDMAGGGAIVNIASVFGMVGFRGSSPYSAAKAGVIGLTRQLAADYGPRGIRVNAVAPGVVVTPATVERIESNRWLTQAMIATAPLGRAAQPEDVAEAVYFLGSDGARHISSVVLPVDGGWTGTRFHPDR